MTCSATARQRSRRAPAAASSRTRSAYAQMNNPAVTLITQTSRVRPNRQRQLRRNCLPERRRTGQPRERRRPLRCMADAGFGSPAPATPTTLRLWTAGAFVRTTGSYSVGVQHRDHAAALRIVRYFRRIQGNFYTMDNEAYGPNDWTEFSAIVPSNPELPSGRSSVVSWIRLRTGVRTRSSRTPRSSGSRRGIGTGSISASTRPVRNAASSRGASCRQDDD